MAKKKLPKKISATETVHFRPGHWLGQTIAQQADTWDLSRGAAAKRLVGLAVCGLTHDAYSDIEELRRISAGNFEAALQNVYVEIIGREQENHQPLDSEERRGVVKGLLQRYRLLHGLAEEQSPEERQQVKVRRSEE